VRRAARILPAALVVAAVLAAIPGRAGAQAAPGRAADSVRVEERRALWQAMTELERLEIAAAGVARPTSDSAALLAADRRRAQDTLVAALDRAVLGEPWGPDELAQLRIAFPGSRLLNVYAARLAERRGDAAAALATVDALLRKAPADADLQRWRGGLLERLGRSAEAEQAYARALDLEPESDSTFRALQRLAESRGTLADLLAQVERLRIRLPASHALADHETEVRQRLGARSARRDSAPTSGGRR